MEYEHDGYTYRFEKLKLSQAKECMERLTTMGFFENTLESLTGSAQNLDELERRLFRDKLHLLNEQGEWVPMGKELTENHFAGRYGAYLHILLHAITYNFEDFLGGGPTTVLGAEIGQA